jgi:hypothetical protein
MQSCHREASKHETRYSHIRYIHYHGAGTVDHSDLAQLALETADHGTHHPTVVRPLAADALATQMMGLSIEGEIAWDFHTIGGCTGLVLMAVLAMVGTWSKWSDRQAVLTSFHRFAIPICGLSGSRPTRPVS